MPDALREKHTSTMPMKWYNKEPHLIWEVKDLSEEKIFTLGHEGRKEVIHTILKSTKFFLYIHLYGC